MIKSLTFAMVSPSTFTVFPSLDTAITTSSSWANGRFGQKSGKNAKTPPLAHSSLLSPLEPTILHKLGHQWSSAETRFPHPPDLLLRVPLIARKLRKGPTIVVAWPSRIKSSCQNRGSVNLIWDDVCIERLSQARRGLETVHVSAGVAFFDKLAPVRSDQSLFSDGFLTKSQVISVEPQQVFCQQREATWKLVWKLV